MSEEIRVNIQTVTTISKIFHESLKQLQKLGVKWNMAELAVAFNEMVHEYLTDIEKQKKRGYAL